ncbi:MAG: TlpA family protein disulfide reductase [Paludibacter sp.]|nr:TlpA family protein disulfide reductase [Paludibacter sp.]
MRNVIKISLPIIIILVLILSGYKVLSFLQQKKIRDDRIAYLPSFIFETTQGQSYTNSSLKKKLPVVFIYFNSECDFCQFETQDIERNIRKLKGVQLIFVSFEPIQKIIMFQKIHKLDIYDNVIFLSDYKNIFSETFGVETLPSSLVYDKNGKLVSRNNGAVKVDYLLKAVKITK